MAEKIVFEQPLNEKCRTMLRLSHLFEQFDFHTPQQQEWHTRGALSALLDIASILARADIKSELLKEMDRYRAYLSRMADTPGVDSERLDLILADLKRVQQALQTHPGQLGQTLRKNDFLNSILQRNSIAGGNFDFDLPQYHYWLQQPHEYRVAQLIAWRSDVATVYDSVALLLALIRNSTMFRREQAQQGFYQQNLPSSSSIQMVRIALDAQRPLYGEISGGKHRFTIRFMDTTDLQSPTPTEENVKFDLSICII